jgi:copper(I)-binding protein
MSRHTRSKGFLMRKACLIIGALTASVPNAMAALPTMSVQQAWSRATPPGAQTAVVYMTIVDSGTPDVLLSLTTPIAGMATMHRTVTHDHTSQMLPVKTLAISAGQPVVFAPGGYHVMLTSLHQALLQGQNFPITLMFQHAGAVDAQVRVQAIGAGGPPADPIAGMDMSMPMKSP